MARSLSAATHPPIEAAAPRLRLAALGLPLVMLLGLALRLAPWLSNPPLHHDEALYGSWARLIASGQDPLLLTSWVDKPPLTLYLIAGSFIAFGSGEVALRLPGMIAGLLLIPVTYGFARRALGAGPALLAAALVSLSPFAIAFAPTAFTDGWLTLFLVASAWAALARKPFASGLLLGLAVASKQQGVLGVPLILALLALNLPPRRRGLHYLAAFGLAALGCALILAPVTWWDSLRFHNRPSFWDRSLQTYGGLLLAPLEDWPRRAAVWAGQLRYLAGPTWLSWALLALPLIACRPILRHPVTRLLFLYVAGYLALHVAVTFQPWDRYLLPLVPLLSVLLAFVAARLYGWTRAPSLSAGAALARRNGFFLVALAVTAALLWGAWLATSGRLPVGSNSAVYEGVSSAAQLVRSQPSGTVVYYRRLGWHLDYYLFDAPQERRWYGDAGKIATDAGLTARDEPGRPQLLILPDWENYTLPGIEAALGGQNLRLEPDARILRSDGAAPVTLYRISPRVPPGSGQ